MTHPLAHPLSATPTQRNRRLLLTLPACALPMLSACGGGADLSYDSEQPLYMVGEAITPNNPHVTTSNPNVSGATAPTFSVTPALPAGLTLNATTGVISGTPTKLRRQASHTVVARNNRGVAETQIRVTVTGRGAWSAGAASQHAKRLACIATLPDGKVLVAGGLDNSEVSDSTDIYDPVTGTWMPAAPMPLFARGLKCVPLRDGRVLVFGGGFVQSALYDPATQKWTPTGDMVAPRSNPSSCLLPDGKVLVTGGRLAEALDTVERYDPGTGAWTALPKPMSDPRYDHAAAVLPGGKSVLLVGGTSSSSGMTRAELYALDGSASKFIPSAVTGFGSQAVPLDDGSVLVVSDATVSWRFYPRTSTWTTSPQVAARDGSQTVRLADGRVLRAGGVELNTAEIYNPDVNIWTPAAPMAESRGDAMTTLLADGRVLMVNGVSSGPYLFSIELYTP